MRQVGPGVLVAHSDLYRTASGVVTAAGAALLIDPGVLPGELAALAAELAQADLPVAAGVATHAHWDHVLWARGLGRAPRWATPATVELLAARRAELVEAPLQEEAVQRYVEHDLELAGRLTAAPADGLVPWAGPAVRLVPAGGHCPGHAGVLVEAAGVLFAGDMVSDLEPPLPDWELLPDPLAAYRRGLEALAGLAGVELVVPGHGAPGDAAALRRRADADRAYLDALEAAVAPVVRAGGDQDEAVRAAAGVPDPRLDGWPPMRAAHADNARGLWSALRRA